MISCDPRELALATEAMAMERWHPKRKTTRQEFLLKRLHRLLSHAARKVLECAADLLHWKPARVSREARAPLLLTPSIKAALDRDWSDPAQKASMPKEAPLPDGSQRVILAMRWAGLSLIYYGPSPRARTWRPSRRAPGRGRAYKEGSR